LQTQDICKQDTTHFETIENASQPSVKQRQRFWLDNGIRLMVTSNTATAVDPEALLALNTVRSLLDLHNMLFAGHFRRCSGSDNKA
jgi:hypothetical protein